TVIEAMRLLATKLDELTPARRAQLRRLPLWTARGWRGRPIFACDDDRLAQEAGEKIPIWDSGMSGFDGCGDLLDALEVKVLTAADFTPVALDTTGAIEGEKFRPLFVRAVDHLRDELARGDQPLHD